MEAVLGIMNHESPRRPSKIVCCSRAGKLVTGVETACMKRQNTDTQDRRTIDGNQHIST